MATKLNSRALKTIREQRRLNLSDVADFTKISRTRLGMFEEGQHEPSRKQIEKLANVYGIPAYAFFRDAIPNIPETLLDFRQQRPSPAILSPRGMRSLWAAEKIARFAHQLLIELRYEAPGWAAAFKGHGVTATDAAALRTAFDEWFARRSRALQLTGPSEQQYLAALRLFFEVQGAVVNINDAPPDDYLGFFMEPEGALPVVFVNRKISSKKAQLFTFVHEFAHSRVRAQGVSNPFLVRNDVERACNAFAAEFLAPMREFRAIAEAVSAASRQDVFQYVAIVSLRLLLSKHATAIRLREADLITQDQMNRFDAAWRQYASDEKETDDYDALNFGVPHAKRLSELGYLPAYLASEAVGRGLIDTIDVQVGMGLSEALQNSAFDLANRRIKAARD